MVNRDLLEEANLYFITSEASSIPFHKQVLAALDSGVKMIQYRRKEGSTRELYLEAKGIKELCIGKALFIINDHLDIALAVGADGVHIGQDDLPGDKVRPFLGNMLLGISTHTMEQAEKASEIADYIGIGPVHKTNTKKDSDDVLGVTKALKIAKTVEIPTVAIGGIEYEDLTLLAEEFNMVCAISSLFKGDILKERVKLFEEEFCIEKKRRLR